MDIQKEREAFQKFCEENFDFERHEQTYFDEQTQCYENDIGEDTESINMAWSAWQAAKSQAVPEGFVLVPKEPTETMIQNGTKANSECLNENAPLGERLFRHPALQVYQAMVNGSGE